MDTKEKIIQFLLELPRHNNTTMVVVHRENIQSLGISESTIFSTLSDLDGMGYINITKKSQHGDFSMPMYLVLLSPILNYNH